MKYRNIDDQYRNPNINNRDHLVGQLTRKGQAKKIKGNIKRKDFLWGEGSREEIGISVRGNFPSFLSVFEKGEFCG